MQKKEAKSKMRLKMNSNSMGLWQSKTNYKKYDNSHHQGVPTTLKNLSEANIKIWILTGDKLETAREIGSSCGILNDSLLVEFSMENCRMASSVL